MKGRRTISTGDYKQKEGGTIVGSPTVTATAQKLLVNIGNERKSWLERVAETVDEGTVTEVMRAVIDFVSAEHPPEEFATVIKKWRLKSRLDELKRRKQEVANEEAQLLKELDNGKVNA